MLVLTLLIYCLFERRIRLTLKAENEPFHVVGSYKTVTPTGVIPHLVDHGCEICVRKLRGIFMKDLPRISEAVEIVNSSGVWL